MLLPTQLTLPAALLMLTSRSLLMVDGSRLVKAHQSECMEICQLQHFMQKQACPWVGRDFWLCRGRQWVLQEKIETLLNLIRPAQCSSPYIMGCSGGHGAKPAPWLPLLTVITQLQAYISV